MKKNIREELFVYLDFFNRINTSKFGITHHKNKICFDII